MNGRGPPDPVISSGCWHLQSEPPACCWDGMRDVGKAELLVCTEPSMGICRSPLDSWEQPGPGSVGLKWQLSAAFRYFIFYFFRFGNICCLRRKKKKATPTTGSLLLRLCWGDVPVHSCHRNTEQCNAPAATKHTNQFLTAKPSGTNKPSRNCTGRKIQTRPLCSALPMSCPTGWNCSVVPELCSSQQWGSARRKCFAHCFDASILSSAPDSQKGGWVKSLWEHSRGWISQLDASWKFGAEHTSLRSCFLAEFPSGFVYFFLIIFGHFGGRFFAIPTRCSAETFMLHVAQHHSSCPETTNGHLEGICSWRKFPFTCNNEKSINAQNTMMNTILSHSGATSLPYWYHQKMLIPLEASSQLSFLIIPHSIQPFLLPPYCHSTTSLLTPGVFTLCVQPFCLWWVGVNQCRSSLPSDLQIRDVTLQESAVTHCLSLTSCQ